jgi:hypothetical protein
MSYSSFSCIPPSLLLSLLQFYLRLYLLLFAAAATPSNPRLPRSPASTLTFISSRVPPVSHENNIFFPYTSHLLLLLHYFRDNEPLSLRGARLRVNDITRQLDMLKLPGQRHTYVEHPLTIASQTDPAISLAITRSIKAAAVMQVDSEGRRTSTKRLYLDSSMLQQHLRSIRDGRVSAFASERAAEVTIFVLSLDSPHPLFVVRRSCQSPANSFCIHYISSGLALSSGLSLGHGRRRAECGARAST